MQMAEAEFERQERDRANAVAQQQHEEAQQARALEEARMQAAELVAAVHAAPPTAVAQHDGVHRSPFASLPDTLMVEMLRGYTTPEVCHVLQATRTLSALSQYAPFGECHLRDGVATGDGVRPSKQLQFARRLGEARASLCSMHIDCGSAEVDVVRYLLQECDTERLTRVTIRVERDCGQMSRALELSGASSAHALDLDSGDALQRQVAVTEVLRRFSDAIRPETARTLTGCLAQSCANLSHLALVKQVDDVPSLARIQSLTSLEAHFLEADDINFILAELPMLRRLIVTGGSIVSLAGEQIDLESASLEVIDLTAATKGLTFERIRCPRLRQIRCQEYGPMSNGLVVAFRPNVAPATAPDGYMTYNPRDRRAPTNVAGLCIFGSYNYDHSSHPRALIEIPAECTVTWGDGDDVVSATTASTLAEFAHQFAH